MEALWQAIENAWNGILDLMSRLVMPDWGGLVALIPVALAALVALFLVWAVRRWSSAGPRRRGKGRLEPRPPAGVHMPGPSFAPLFAAVGAFLLFFGIVLGGIAFWLGVGALVVTLLYWLREGIRDYEHVDGPIETLPAVVQEPPAGIHVPGPSFRPLLVASAAAVLFFGIVFGGALLLAGVIILAGALIGWLRDARREYVATVEADRTGHLEAGPEPRMPTGSLAVAGLIVALAVAVNAGIIPPTESADGGGPTSSAGASSSPGVSAAPSAAPSLEVPAADVTVNAKGFAFDPKDISTEAGTAFTIAFVNGDAGVPHDMVIRDGSGAVVFTGEPVTGVKAMTYEVPALPAGTYPFVCSFHANMTGTLTTQ